jgi:hypothetical protein
MAGYGHVALRPRAWTWRSLWYGSGASTRRPGKPRPLCGLDASCRQVPGEQPRS